MFSFFKAKEPPPPTHRDLMNALKFSDAELKANRAGYLTQAQRLAMQRRQRWQAVFTWSMAAFIAFTMWLVGSSVSDFFVRKMGNIGLILPLLIFAALMVMFVWMAFKFQSQTKADLYKGHVSSINGRVQRHTYVVYTGKTAYRVYELHVMGEVFRVSGKVYNAFVDDGSYDIFYAPNTRTLLSAERL